MNFNLTNTVKNFILPYKWFSGVSFDSSVAERWQSREDTECGFAGGEEIFHKIGVEVESP
jgi:hypothetical protein